MLWTHDNVLVAPHTAVGPGNYELVVNVSLDGGRTWVDGSADGTAAIGKSTPFVLVPNPPGFSYTTPTVQLDPKRYLTVHASGSPLAIHGVLWRIEQAPAEQTSTTASAE